MHLQMCEYIKTNMRMGKSDDDGRKIHVTRVIISAGIEGRGRLKNEPIC
jgi:hypothetical protein